MTRSSASHESSRRRSGLSLVEVIVALSILGGVLLALGMFSARLSQSTSTGRIRIQAAQLASDRLETVKSAPRYSAIESLYVATENTIAGNPGYARRTWVQRVGGAVTDTAGPFKQMPEPFGAFFIVEAADIDEAVAVAKLHPGTHLGEKFGEGGIEVRPIDFVEQP